MRYWWVNHKQTARQEIEGGYLWSPKRTKDDRRSQFYDNMLEARPGDGVLSFADGEIRYVGRVAGNASEGEKPTDFGLTGENWSKLGWRLPVEWTPLNQPVRPKSRIEEFRHWLPQKYSPMRLSGDGNQGAYLSEVPAELFGFLLDLGGGRDAWSTGGVTSASRLASGRRTYATPETSEREQNVKVRIGQGLFRIRIKEFEHGCRVTGVSHPRLLVASHIKPWRACSTEERLDGANGLLLAPHVDRLFDRGLISFENDGRVLVSERLDKGDLDRLGLGNLTTANVGSFAPAQWPYLAHHRTSVFNAA